MVLPMALYVAMAISQAVTGLDSMLVLLFSIVSMVLFNQLSEKLNRRWLKEWSMGFAVLSSMLFGIILKAFLYLCVFHNGFPGVRTLISATAAMLGIEAYVWILEPIMYLPILGIPGIYIGYTAGNIANMRIPCATAAQSAVGASLGTRKSEMAGIFGIIASVVVNLLVLLIVIIFGDFLLKILPKIVQDSFEYAIPAVYGTLITMMFSLFFKNKKQH